MTKNAITTIPFHGANILVSAGETPDKTLVAMKPVVEGMGLDWAGQFTKLKSHPVLSKGIGEISIPSAGGSQLMTALPLNRFHFWLATIQSNKIKDLEVRRKVIIFQTEAADVLFEHFFGRAIASSGDDRTNRTLGIAKSTIHKVTHIERTVESLAAALASLAQIVSPSHPGIYVQGKTSGEIWEAHGLPMGIKNAPRWLGNRLSEMGCQIDDCRVIRLGMRGARMYDADKAAVCMKNGLSHTARDYVASRTGQGKLKLRVVAQRSAA